MRRTAYRLTPPVVPEHPLQKQLCDALRREIGPPGKVCSGVVWWCVDHANYAGEVPGVRIGRGIVAGIPDFFILCHGRAHFFELKTAADTARLSDAQISVASAILFAGGAVGAGTCMEELLACLDEWRIPRKRLL